MHSVVLTSTPHTIILKETTENRETAKKKKQETQKKKVSNSSLQQKKETYPLKFLSGSSSEYEIVLVNICDDNSGLCGDDNT